MYCFLAYVAMRTTDPGVRDMLAYGRLLIKEALRHGGKGWLDYDRVFRQQAAIDQTLRWNSLHPGIQASTLVGPEPGPVMLCALCREPDHTSEHCALAYLQPPTSQSSAAMSSPSLSNPPTTSFRPQAHYRRRPESLASICVSWNKGWCRYPGTCNYQHICATCHQNHRARECAATPVDSDYKKVGN